jgi:hypothetical protein
MNIFVGVYHENAYKFCKKECYVENAKLEDYI